MGKVQKYLKQKKIKEQGLPKVYVVHSTTEGVAKPVERQVEEIKEKCGQINRYMGGKELLTISYDRHILDKSDYPYEFDLEEGKSFNKDEGHSSGFGDLWCWTYATFLNKEDAEKYYEEEKRRVHQKYILPNNMEDHIIEKAYKKYLELPKASVGENRDAEIYAKGWYILTGRSIMHPHPHRHYTLSEFAYYFGKDEEFYNRFV